MNIYFADANLKILGQATSSLPHGFRIIDDKLHESALDGVNSFEATIAPADGNATEMMHICEASKYILMSTTDSYNSIFTISETEFNTVDESIYIYSEDVGLDLLGRQVPAQVFTNSTLGAALQRFIPADWIRHIDSAIASKTLSIEFDGENTAIARMRDLCEAFGAEFYFTFDIDGFKVNSKNINIIPKRGSLTPIASLRLGREIDDINIITSYASVATALIPTGKDIDLKGYSYSYTDEKGDLYQVRTDTGIMVCTTAMARMATAIDTDGYIVQYFSFETEDKAVLAGQARAALQKIVYPEQNYEIKIVELPESVEVGDRINLIDDKHEIYVESRVLELDTSQCSGTVEATIGENLIRTSGISEVVAGGGTTGRDGEDAVGISIESSGGNIFHNVQIDTTLKATVFKGSSVISTQAELEAVFGAGATIAWYDGETLLATGMTYNLVSSTNKNITAKLEVV